MLDRPSHEPARANSDPRRDAWPPPPPARPFDPNRYRSEALNELAELIAQLERWRRHQAMRKEVFESAWVFIRDPKGPSVRVRFERGRPSQLRASAADRVHAFSIASAALDLSLRPNGRWERDRRTLDWSIEVEVE